MVRSINPQKGGGGGALVFLSKGIKVSRTEGKID